MTDNISRKGILWNESGNIFGVIDSFDGSEHKNSEEGIKIIISYSFNIFCEKSFHKGIKTSQSLKILTWKKIIGKENKDNVLKSVKIHYENKKTLFDALLCIGKEVDLYDMNYGKMLYILTQHSIFTRKYHPFLLCSCGRGDGLIDPNHQCEIIDHEDKIIYYDRSLRIYKRKLEKCVEEIYSNKMHMDRVDKDN